MINRILVTLFAAISVASFGQTDKYIEVSVSETVELKAQSAVLKITKKEMNDDYLDYDYEYYNDDTYYLDQEYYRMLEESPKKVTEEMHQAFQDRQYQREIQEQERLVRLVESQELADNSLKNFAEKLRAENIDYSLTTEEKMMNQNWFSIEGEGDDEVEEVMYVTVTDEEQYNKLIALSEDLPISIQNHEIIYEKIESKRQEFIENLSKNAKTEAEMIAKSMNKKLGSVLTISNLLPIGSMPYENLELYYDVLGNLNPYGAKSISSPFSATKKTTVGYVYRFALLD